MRKLCAVMLGCLILGIPLSAKAKQDKKPPADSSTKPAGKPAPAGKKAAGKATATADPDPAALSWQTWGEAPCDTSKVESTVARGRHKFVVFQYVVQSTPVKDLPFIVVADPGNPAHLYAGQGLVVQIQSPKDLPLASVDNVLPLVSVEIGTSKADPLNPAPLRPTIGISSASLGYVKPEYRYTCAYKQLVGDTIPSVTVTAYAQAFKKESKGGTDEIVKDGDAKKITLIQTGLPQVHVLSYFNVATGIVASTIRDTNFNRVQTALKTASDPAQFATVSSKADPRVVPALFFTAYVFRPVDAEAPFDKHDLIPEPSIGFSLTSPSSDFFFGGSSEFFVRNVQLVYGFHYGQTNHLVKGAIDDPTSSSAPATEKRFDKGAFVGLTFNIDFIKGLFSGGGK